MTLDEFIKLIRSIDPKAERYDSIGQPGEKYTVYTDYMETAFYADNVPAEKIDHVQVEYYTVDEDDPIARAYMDAFTDSAEIYCSYDKDFDEHSRMIRHLFDCQII